MSDIIERLRGLADLFEAGDAPRHVVMHMRAGADEIERLRGRLEIDPSHPYDGIYARDETIRGLEKEIARLRAGGCARDQGTTQYCAEAAKKDAEISRLLNLLADARTESMKLRAALREVMDDLTLIGKNNWLPVGLLDDVIYVNARAALNYRKMEEGRT